MPETPSASTPGDASTQRGSGWVPPAGFMEAQKPPPLPAPGKAIRSSVNLRVMTVVRSVAGSLWKDCGHQAATNRRGLSDHDLDPLKLFDLGVASSRHGLSQRSQQVHGAVGNCRWTQQDVLQGADR